METTIKLQGNLKVLIRDTRNNTIVDEIDLGKNTITTRAKLVVTRIMAANLKSFYSLAGVGTAVLDLDTSAPSAFNDYPWDGIPDPMSKKKLINTSPILFPGSLVYPYNQDVRDDHTTPANDTEHAELTRMFDGYAFGKVNDLGMTVNSNNTLGTDELTIKNGGGTIVSNATNPFTAIGWANGNDGWLNPTGSAIDGSQVGQSPDGGPGTLIYPGGFTSPLGLGQPGSTTAEYYRAYSLNISGMAFGNGGHLIGGPASAFVAPSGPADADSIYDGKAGPCLGVNSNRPSLNKYVMLKPTYYALYPAAAPQTVAKPAMPFIAAGQFGYSGIVDNPTPDPGFYEQTHNGNVPESRNGFALADNDQGTDESNTTLFSETLRLPLDRTDGVQWVDYKTVRFKCTIPADCELNQTRLYGYMRTHRNYITEAGLVTGDNMMVQSPDPRCNGNGDLIVNHDWADTDVGTGFTPAGISNLQGAQLSIFRYDSAAPADPNNAAVGGVFRGSLPPYTDAIPQNSLVPLSKDFFTKVRTNDAGSPESYLDDDNSGSKTVNHWNNTWNLAARRVFPIQVKTPTFEFVFLWTLTL